LLAYFFLKLLIPDISENLAMLFWVGERRRCEVNPALAKERCSDQNFEA
jgi:hypothetical protein